MSSFFPFIYPLHLQWFVKDILDDMAPKKLPKLNIEKLLPKQINKKHPTDVEMVEYVEEEDPQAGDGVLVLFLQASLLFSFFSLSPLSPFSPLFSSLFTGRR